MDRPDTLHLADETLQGRLPGAQMLTLVVDVPNPALQGLIDVSKGVTLEAGEKLGPDGAEESFDLAPALGLGHVGHGEWTREAVISSKWWERKAGPLSR